MKGGGGLLVGGWEHECKKEWGNSKERILRGRWGLRGRVEILGDNPKGGKKGWSQRWGGGGGGLKRERKQKSQGNPKMAWPLT